MRSDLLMREFGSCLVLAPVRCFFIPFIRAQKLLRLLDALLPFLSLLGLVVTAVCKWLPPHLAQRWSENPTHPRVSDLPAHKT